jgi:hypothetical protein
MPVSSSGPSRAATSRIEPCAVKSASVRPSSARPMSVIVCAVSSAKPGSDGSAPSSGTTRIACSS